jgi:hypothetical protein
LLPFSLLARFALAGRFALPIALFGALPGGALFPLFPLCSSPFLALAFFPALFRAFLGASAFFTAVFRA